jgi:diguanylate cyclase (GGDEF)-like protein
MGDAVNCDRGVALPPNEEERLHALDELELIGAGQVEQVDRICALARDLFKVPIAIVTVIDRDTQSVLASSGIALGETRREDTLCNTAILADAPLVVPDAAGDPRFDTSMMVRGPMKIRFYAGAPLRIRPGINIGTLCIVDPVPRNFGAEEQAQLAALADITVSEILGWRTARKLEASQKRLAQITRMAKIGGFEFSVQSGKWIWDDTIFRIYGIPLGTPASEDLIVSRYDPEMRDKSHRRIEGLFKHGIPYDIELHGTRPNGESFWVRVLAETEMNDGKYVRVIGAVQDISGRKHNEARIHDLTYLDALTGLPNHASFIAKLNDYIDAAQASSSRVALIKFNVDHFRDVNDTFGHQTGDALLQSVANGLRQSFAALGTVTHIGGDEFGVIMHGPAVDKAEQYAKDFIEQAKTLFRHDDATLPLSISAGIAVFPDHAENADVIMKNAKVSLFRAKAQRRGSVVVFDPEIRKAADEKDALVRKIRQGIDNHEFIMVYQPIVGLRDGKVSGLEALMRWNDPERGILAPAHFAIAFEEPGLAIRLGDVALDSAIAQMRVWLDDGVAFGSVAVNLSTAQFRLTDLPDIILGKLRRAGVPTHRLTLEVTETVYMGWGADVVAATVRKLHEAGVGISLDDFGTGYASLSHLRQFPIDKLKIDKSFVQSIESAAIVDAVINMGLSLGMQVVAEGVEKPEQIDLLRLKGCDFVQGYIYSKPLEPDRVAGFIAAFSTAATGSNKKLAAIAI